MDMDKKKILSMPVLLFGMCWYLLPQQPELALKLYDSLVSELKLRDTSSIVPLGIRSASMLILPYVLAIELDDKAVVEKLHPHIERLSQGRWFGENSEEEKEDFGYFFFLMEKYPRGQLSALLMCAQVMGAGDWQRAFNGNSDRFAQPTVCGVQFPSMGLSRACNKGDTLLVSTYCATHADRGMATTFRVSNVPSPAATRVTRNGELFDDWFVSEENGTLTVKTVVTEANFVFHFSGARVTDFAKFITGQESQKENFNPVSVRLLSRKAGQL